MDERNAIVVDGVSKFYRNQVALDGLSLQVPEGSVFGLLGENGAGKTTAIQVLMGMIRPDAGQARVLGLDPQVAGIEVRRRVGFVPEVPTLYDWMTVSEIGWFAAGFHPEAVAGTGGYLTRYAETTRSFGLPADRKIRALSKGMRAKVSLSLALASNPALLILDEPTSGLDALVRREFLESMVDLAADGRTVFLSSHQIGEVERVASHVALIHNGRLVLTESLDSLRSHVFRLAVSFQSRDHLEAPPASLSLELIDAAIAPRQSHWLVRARDRTACEAVRALPGVEAVQIESPSLEDIYIGYMRGRRPAARPCPGAAHVA